MNSLAWLWIWCYQDHHCSNVLIMLSGQTVWTIWQMARHKAFLAGNCLYHEHCKWCMSAGLLMSVKCTCRPEISYKKLFLHRYPIWYVCPSLIPRPKSVNKARYTCEIQMLSLLSHCLCTLSCIQVPKIAMLLTTSTCSVSYAE